MWLPLLILVPYICCHSYVVKVGDLLEVAQEKKLDHTLFEIRRSIHSEPEIGLSLPKTAQKVRKILDNLRIDEERISEGWALNKTEGTGYGIVVDFGTGKPPCVLVRADMDALPINELVDVPWKSKISNAMHACGHDAHTAMLCGVATFLRYQEGRMQGTIRLVFQPGEEGHYGMKWMLEEGLLERFPPPQRAIALHVHPAFPSGSIVGMGGSVVAGGTHFEATIEGQGGHPGIPAGVIDPIIAAANLINAWQSLTSRETLGKSARSPGLLVVTQINSIGSASNVVPDKVILKGTIRAMSPEVITYMRRRAEEIGHGVCLTYRCKFSIDIEEGLLNLYNDYKVIAELTPVLEDVNRILLEPGEFSYIMEDFALVSHKIPSAMFLLGVHDPTVSPPTNYSLHNPRFNLDEKALVKGATFLTASALHLLQVLAAPNNKSDEL